MMAAFLLFRKQWDQEDISFLSRGKTLKNGREELLF